VTLADQWPDVAPTGAGLRLPEPDRDDPTPAEPQPPGDGLTDEEHLAALIANEPSPAPVNVPRLRFQSMRELCAEVDALGPPTWLFQGVWPADAYGVVAAEDKAGKTWVTSDAAVTVATGGHWLSLFPCQQPGRVLVFVGEGGKRNTVRRLRAVAEAHGVVAEDLDIVVVDRVPHLSSAIQLAEVAAHLADSPTRLVILDPLYLAARGSSGSDLYAMGEALEGLQHICQHAAAALLVVTHFKKTSDVTRRSTARTSSRITGVGPSAWGRVLMTGTVESRYTDPDSKLSRVVLEWEIVGGEVPDQRFRTVREVWSDNPEDLASALHVTWAKAEDDEPGPTGERTVLDEATPAARRVHAALASADRPLTVKDIGDVLAHEGRPLKVRTIQDALTKLGALVDSLVVDSRGTTQWSLHTPTETPADTPPDEPDPWTQEALP
jgi:hypothetical protein